MVNKRLKCQKGEYVTLKKNEMIIIIIIIIIIIAILLPIIIKSPCMV